MPSPQSERSARAKIAGLSRSAQAPSGASISAPARKAFLQSFYDRTDPDLKPKERERQAEALRKIYFTQLAQRSARGRRRAALAQADADAAEAELARYDDAV